jgi:7-cyano-7-deazaguanine synthase
MKNNKVILLLSGGIDSTTLLALLSHEKKEIHCLSFDYGQKHKIELDFALNNSRKYNAKEHYIISIDNSLFGVSSSLTNEEIKVDKYSVDNKPTGLTNAFVPGRNLIFISYAAAYAETIDCNEIYMGCNADDTINFPDCAAVFFTSLNPVLAAQSRNNNLKIITPFIIKSKAEVIALARKLNVDLSHTLSCYEPIGKVECGRCLSCILKIDAMKN